MEVHKATTIKVEVNMFAAMAAAQMAQEALAAEQSDASGTAACTEVAARTSIAKNLAWLSAQNFISVMRTAKKLEAIVEAAERLKEMNPSDARVAWITWKEHMKALDSYMPPTHLTAAVPAAAAAMAKVIAAKQAAMKTQEKVEAAAWKAIEVAYAAAVAAAKLDE